MTIVAYNIEMSEDGAVAVVYSHVDLNGCTVQDVLLLRWLNWI